MEKTVRYISTRGRAPALSFEEVLLEGLARDGGLYVPDTWPELSSEDLRRFVSMPYADVACEVMLPFVGDAIPREQLQQVCNRAYQSFQHRRVAPLFELAPNRWLLELYHGPTLAFKDVAMQVLTRLYDHVLSRADRRITVVGATSGDTGGAAIEAFRRSERADIFIMHPAGRTSEVQRRQMTTVDAPNVHNLAIEGTFDDCQDLLKAMFNDEAFRDEVHLSGINSINWARVMPQIVYYVTAAASLGAFGDTGRRISFTVPTGNFGDIYAGYAAKQMGVPIDRLVIASNSNDILTRVLTTGEHALDRVQPTLSPSMDIQVSSNFERLLFDLFDRNGQRVRDCMSQLQTQRVFRLEEQVLKRARAGFDAVRASDEETYQTICRVFQQTGFQIDPHTAVGVFAAEAVGSEMSDESPMVVLATAHPAKFPDAVEASTGLRPALPHHLADLLDRTEHFETLPNDLGQVQSYIHTRTSCA